LQPAKVCQRAWAFASESTSDSGIEQARWPGDPLLRRVGANGPWKVYETRDDFYYFGDGILRKADQGQIWANCLNNAIDCELSSGESPEVEP
jgi:hypothetical protein